MPFDKFKKKTSYDVILVTFLQGLTGLLALITNIFIARLYGKDIFGQYSFYFGILSLLVVIPIFGMSDFNAKYPSQNNLKISLKYTIYLGVTLCTIVSIIALIFNFTFILYLLPYLFIYPFFSLINGAFRGVKNFFLMNIFIILRYFLYLIFIIFAYYLLNNKELGTLFIIMALPSLILIPIFYHFKDQIPKTASQTINSKQIIFLFLLLVNFTIFLYLDKVLLRISFPFTDIATYTAYSNIINILKLISGALAIVIVPTAISKKLNIKKSVTKLTLFLIPVTAILVLLSYYLVPILYGENFKIYSIMLPTVMGLSAILLSIHTFLNSVLVGEMNYNFKYVIFEVSMSVIVLPLLFLLLVNFAGINAMAGSMSLILILKIFVNLYYIQNNREEGIKK